MRDAAGQPRVPGSALSLLNLAQSLSVNAQGIMHNAGNDAFLGMLNIQLLLDPEETKIPTLWGQNIQQTVMRNSNKSPMGMASMTSMGNMPMGLPSPMMPMYGMMPMGSPVVFPQISADSYLDQDSASIRRGSPVHLPPSPAGSGRPRKPSNLSLAEGRSSSSQRGGSSPGRHGTVDEAAQKMSSLRVG